MLKREGFSLFKRLFRDGGDVGAPAGAVKVNLQLIDRIGRRAIQRGGYILFRGLRCVDGDEFNLIGRNDQFGVNGP